MLVVTLPVHWNVKPALAICCAALDLDQGRIAKIGDFCQADIRRYVMFDRSGAVLQNEGVARRIFGATLVALAVALMMLLSAADAPACPSDVSSKAPAAISQESHDKAMVVAARQVEAASNSIMSSAVRLIDRTHCCGISSQSGDFGCPGQCCVACSAAIGATALGLPSPDRSGDISLLADWAFSLRPPPLFRPPRSLA